MVSGVAGATTVSPIITGCRVVNVRISLPGVTAPTVPQNIKFEWTSDVGKPSQHNINNMGTMGISRVFTPPTNSRSAMWSRAGSLTATLEEVLFQFNAADSGIGATTNLYIDVVLEIVEGSASVALITLPAAAAVAGTSYAALDCLSTSNAVGTYLLQALGVESVNGSNVAPITFTRSGA